MSARKKEFAIGLTMMIGFIGVMVFIFAPIINGGNCISYLDNMYNSISKGSAYYIPKVRTDAGEFMGQTIQAAIKIDNAAQVDQTAALFTFSGAAAIVEGQKINVSGDLGKIIENCLADTDAMYHNEGGKVSAKYNCDERVALNNWYNALKGIEKELIRQKEFAKAKILGAVMKRGIEPAYNYYTIQPKKISGCVGIVIFSLVFYVVYTMWYGYAILYLFEGWGLQIEEH